MFQSGNRLDLGKLLRSAVPRLIRHDRCEIRISQCGRDQIRAAVNRVIAIAEGHAERHADANVPCGTGNRLGFAKDIPRPLGAMTVIYRAYAAGRQPCKSRRRTQIRIDDWLEGKERKPQLQCLVSGAKREGPLTVPMVVRIDQCRHHQEPVAANGRGIKSSNDTSLNFDG
jgi:hypothetical protein